MPRTRLYFWLFILASLLCLLATVIPAPFTIDDCNYASTVAGIRHGTIFLPGTDGLPPSRGLYAYEPTASALQSPESPVPPMAPPLYALIAYPFSFLGWHGLVLLNVLAALATLILVYAAARRLANQEAAGWYAALLWFLGGSTIEYAQGLWPHMLAVSMCTAGMILIALAVMNRRPAHASLAGFLFALAAGMRYQDAILLVSGGLVLLAWHPRRLRACLAYALGALPPLIVSSLLNHARIHTWNPVSKGARYVGTGAGHYLSPVHEFLLTLWSRVVDYSAQPAFHNQTSSYLHKLPTGDMVTAWGVLKKSWMQGSPWILVGFLVLLLAWARQDRFGGASRPNLRILAVPVVLVLAVFGMAGIFRHDGMGFSQRYLLELTPFLAIAAAVGLAKLQVRWPWLAIGGGLGVLAATLVLLLGQNPLGFRLQSLLPLFLAILAACTWLVSLGRSRWSGVAGLTIAACLSWSISIHLATDLRASRLARLLNVGRMAILDEAIPPTGPIAILAASGPHTAFCPLLLDRDAVVIVENNVTATELPLLVDTLLEQRRVLVWLENLPEPTYQRLSASYHLTLLRPPALAELTR